MDKIETRPKNLPSKTFAYHLQCGNTYVTICYLNDKPFDVFVHKGHSNSCGRCVAEAIGKLCSFMLRSNVDKDILIEHLSGIKCGSGGFEKDIYIGSCFDAIAKSLGGILNSD